MSDVRPGNPMRIAAFSAIDLSLPQGHAIHLRAILEALHDRGHELCLVTPTSKSRAPDTRFETSKVPILRWHVLGPWGFEIAGGLRLYSLCRKKRCELIYARQDLYTFAPAIVARLLKIPLVVEVNSSIPAELAMQRKRLAGRIAAACERFTLRRAETVFVLAEEQGRSLIQRIGIEPDVVATVPIAARIPNRTDPRETRRIRSVPEGRFVIGYAGNLASIQGVDLLVEAVRALEFDCELWIIGTGDEEERLRNQSRALEQRVRFFGGTDLAETESLLAACQILVAPYRRVAYQRASEGGALSSKILTYLASDRPFLVSDLQSYAWVEEVGAGERFTSDDPNALADRLRAWGGRWVDAGAPLIDWPWSAPGPGRSFVERGRRWEDAAERIERRLGPLCGRGSSTSS